uniref:Protein FAM183A n=1 Tax=Mesocestoides corti TaxID=53468 RepID=A0A5K3FFJ3_MESCO
MTIDLLVFVYTEKPNVKPQVGSVDENLYRIIERSRMEPRKRYDEPQSVNQEYGWISTPIFTRPRNDRRFHFGKSLCEMTRFMGSYWQFKSAASNNAETGQDRRP